MLWTTYALSISVSSFILTVGGGKLSEVLVVSSSIGEAQFVGCLKKAIP